MKKSIQKISYQGGYFHVYNRGNRKQNIFLEKEDYLKYLEKLREYKKKYNISIICYCLMLNHIHLLVRQDSDIPVYKFMHALHTSYSIHINRKYNKIGHLFQGKYKQKEVDKDEYLLQLSSYIHLNPVVDGLVEKLENYQWSSYPDYIGIRQGTLCDKKSILSDQLLEKYKKDTEERIALIRSDLDLTNLKVSQFEVGPRL